MRQAAKVGDRRRPQPRIITLDRRGAQAFASQAAGAQLCLDLREAELHLLVEQAGSSLETNLWLRVYTTAQNAIAASSNAVNFQSVRATLFACGMIAHPWEWMIASTSRFAGGTDFTDCPALALRYAQGSRGVVLVVDIDPDQHRATARLTQAFWFVRDAKRFMLRGRFDQFLTAIIPAKDLRAQLRLRGHRNADDETKAVALHAFIARELRDQLHSQLAPRSEITAWATSHEHSWLTSRER